MYNRLKKIIPYRLLVRLSRVPMFTRIIQVIYHMFFPSLKILQLHTTNRCNYACPYCYSNSLDSKEVNWIDIINQAHKMKVKEISFLGGEPLLDERIDLYIRLCIRNGMNVKIFTNGALIDDKIVKLFMEFDNQISIVVKIDCQSTYEQYTSRESFELVKENIKNCVKNGIQITGHVVITKKNFTKIGDILELGTELSIPLEFERYIPIGKEIDDELKISPEQWNRILDLVAQRETERQALMRSHAIIRGSHCPCYIELLSIKNDGNVLPCPLACDEQVIGNVTKQSLRAVWINFQIMKKQWEKIPDECRLCQHKLLCHGGCKTYAYIHSRSYNAKDPLCNQRNIPVSGQ